LLQDNATKVSVVVHTRAMPGMFSRGTPPDVSAKVKHHFTQKLGVTRLHFKRCNQIANLVDFAHSFLFFNFAILISMSQIAAESVCGLVPIARLATVSNSSRISGVAPKTW
jgi:hypothetical protein